MIVVIDYGIGNLGSVTNALNRLGIPNQISGDPGVIKAAPALILPGVGAASTGMANLKKASLDQTIIRFAKTRKPILGICLGMQLLFSKSQEGDVSCLNLIPGTVKKFTSKNLKVPQIGWNQIKLIKSSQLLKNTANNYAYFVNSYYCLPQQKNTVVATTDYGVSFASVIEQSNLFATQFHPEKSGDFGNIILKNFASLC